MTGGVDEIQVEVLYLVESVNRGCREGGVMARGQSGGRVIGDRTFVVAP